MPFNPELQEALNTAGVAPLIQKDISPELLEYQRRYSPVTRAIPNIKWTSNVYYFNTRTSRVPGGFVTDGGARPVGTSVYAQNSFQIRNLQSVGAVTGFAQEVTRDLIGDLRQREIEGAIQSLYWDIENAIMWGNAGSTVNGPYPEYDGLDVQVAQFTASGSVAQNAIDEAGAAFALRHLDQLIDMVESNMAMPVFTSGWMFIVSPTCNSKIAQLLTNQQRFNDRVEVAAGLLVPTYRDIPILKSSFVSARGAQMGTVVATPNNTTGTLAAGAYIYQVAPIMARFGELVASAEVTGTVSGGTSQVTLSFTPPSGPDAAVPILYKVFRTAVGGGTGTETLLGYVDANVGLAADGVTPIVTTSIIDTGATLIPQNGSTQPANPVAAYTGTNTGHKPRNAGDEDIYLIPRDPDVLVRPWVRDVQPVEVYPTTSSPDSLPFALVSDTTLAIRGPKYVGRLRNLVCTL